MSRKYVNNNKYKKRIEFLKSRLDKSYDIKFREIDVVGGKASVVFIDSIVDKTYISKNIIEPLILNKTNHSRIEDLAGEVLYSSILEIIREEEEAVTRIASGSSIILFNFIEEIISIEAKNFIARAVEEPPTESVIKGPREGFTENIENNVNLIRKKIMRSDLKAEKIFIGKSNTIAVVLIYIDKFTPKSLLDHIKNSINSYENNVIFYSNQVEELLMEPNTPFDTVGYTEKPDVLTSKLAEGRVGILINSSPFALYVPMFFLENMSAPDDYYANKHGANYFRIVRWVSLFIALTLPGLYVALTTHHFTLIPSIFVFRLAVLRSGVPYPTIVEVWIMMFFFQVLREAGVRLPQSIGPAISIVGALILGDAAIRSGLASEVTVLVVALSAIALFLIPKLHAAISIWMNIVLILSAFLGLPGFYIAFILFCSHISGLNSGGYPYMFPLGTFTNYKLKDLIVREDAKDISNNFIKKE